MVLSSIKTARNGCKYLRIEENGKSFCIFETQDWLILAKQYNISPKTISKIKLNQRWCNL